MKESKLDRIKISVIKTLSYADVFDFPMTDSEVWKYYIDSKRLTRKKVRSNLNLMVEEGLIAKIKSYYFLKGRENLVRVRQERQKESIAKIKLAKKASRLLRFISTIKLIGISGSLSMLNAKKTDDIDLFVITSKNTLWITRFLVNIVLVLKGYKRSRNDSFGINLICPNMFLAQDCLLIPKEKQNLFSAHEAMQLKVLVNKNQSYELFLSSNPWVTRFLPNSIKVRNIKLNHRSFGFPFSPINKALYIFQFLYMKGRITSEEVKINIARFHPRDKNEFVMTLYNLRYKRYISLLNYKIKDTISEKSTSSLVTPGY